MSLNQWSPTAEELVNMVQRIENLGNQFGRHAAGIHRHDTEDEDVMKKHWEEEEKHHKGIADAHRAFVRGLAAYTLFGPPDPRP